MRLTAALPLDPANAHVDAYDLAKIVVRFSDTSELVALRWAKVKPADMLEFFAKTYEYQIKADSAIPRIAAVDSLGRGIERREHLVVRDLDLLPHLIEEESEAQRSLRDSKDLQQGRIVAHADWRYRPQGWDWRSPLPYPQANGVPRKAEYPPGAYVELIQHFDEQVEDYLGRRLRPHDCFELVNIATSSTHQRKGIAKTLVTWVFPFADRDLLTVFLMATPAGYFLYKSCGFVQGEGEDEGLKIDRGKWGGSGIHAHVHMKRLPESNTATGEAS